MSLRRPGGRSRGLKRPLMLILAAIATLSIASAAVAMLPSESPQSLRPPKLSDPSVIVVTPEKTRIFLKAGRDYLVRLPLEPLDVPGGLWLVGGRNVVLTGGEIVDRTPLQDTEPVQDAYGIFLQGQTGTVHLEGLWVHGAGVGQAVVLDQRLGATVQIKNSRFEPMHPPGRVHTDGIQSYAGPFRLLLENLTIRTTGTGLQTQPFQYGAVEVDFWEYRRVNIVQTTAEKYALWKSSTRQPWWTELYSDVWVKNVGRFAWPTSAHWRPGGRADVRGESVRRGVPPSGDFVRAKDVGLYYPSSR